MENVQTWIVVEIFKNF